VIRYLSREDLLELAMVIQEHDGAQRSIRDLAALDAALEQPHQAFALADVYPTAPCKAAALGFAIIHFKPFHDGNKRIAHAAIEAVLLVNGFELVATLEQSRAMMEGLAEGTVDSESLIAFVGRHAVQLGLVAQN
jgi:death on curing protein